MVYFLVLLLSFGHFGLSSQLSSLLQDGFTCGSLERLAEPNEESIADIKIVKDINIEKNININVTDPPGAHKCCPDSGCTMLSKSFAA